jgi:hypothetical protein
VSIVPTIRHETDFMILLIGLSALSLTLMAPFIPGFSSGCFKSMSNIAFNNWLSQMYNSGFNLEVANMR